MLQQRTLETLKKLGVEARVKTGRRPHGAPAGTEVWLLGPEQLEVLVVPRTLEDKPAALARFAPELPRLWIAEHVPRRTAMRWIQAERAFVDAAGNAFLSFPGLLVRVLGVQPEAAAGDCTKGEPEALAATEQHAEREWRVPALRLLFHLLCDPELARHPYRKLAEICDVATGTAVQLFQDLEHAGCLARISKRERRLIPTRELVDLWLHGHRRKLYPTLRIGRFTTVNSEWPHGFDPVACNALWGAETAAARLGENLAPGIDTLYTNAQTTELMRAARLRPDPNGRIELRRIFWADPLETATPDTTPILLIAADLLAVRDGRCRALGADLLERVIDGLPQG